MILHGLVRTAVYRTARTRSATSDAVARFAALEPDPDGEARLTRRSRPPHRAVDVLPGHDPGRPAEDRRARIERVRAGGQGQARPAPRGARVPASPDRRDHRHTADAHSVPAAPLTHVRAPGASRHRQGDDPQHDIGLRLHAADNDGALRPLRPRSLRFVHEQEAIDRWIAQALAVADDPDLAREIIECQGVLKGYGAT